MRALGASPFLVASFIVLAIVVAAIAVVGVAAAGQRRERGSAAAVWPLTCGVATAGWMLVTWWIAATGVLLEFDRRPPPFLLMVVAVFTVSVLIAFSRVGTRLIGGLPLAGLIAYQGFRFPLELIMHRAFTEGVMPEQMSYSGRNFDILTGISALVVGVLIWRGLAGRRAALVWNVAGALLLTNILVVAIASTPMFAAFGPDRLNTWVAYAPFIWLPTVFVLAAIAGHFLVWRKLRAER